MTTLRRSDQPLAQPGRVVHFVPAGVPVREHREDRRPAVDPHHPRLARAPRSRARLPAAAEARDPALFEASSSRRSASTATIPTSPGSRSAATRPPRSSRSVAELVGNYLRDGGPEGGASDRARAACSAPTSATSRCAASSTASSSRRRRVGGHRLQDRPRPVGELGEAQPRPACTSTRFLCQEVFGRLPAAIRLMYLSTGEIIEATTVRALGPVRGLAHVGGVEGRRAGVRHRRLQAAPVALCSSCRFQPWCPTFGGDPELARIEAPVAFGLTAA